MRRLIDQHSLSTLAIPVCLKGLVSNRIERDVDIGAAFVAIDLLMTFTISTIGLAAT